MDFTKKTFRSIFVVLGLIILAGVAIWVSYRLFYWMDFPKGSDSVGALFKLELFKNFWPNINWVHSWGGGMPLFAQYPGIMFYFLAFIYAISHLSTEFLLAASGILSVFLSAIAVFWLVYSVTKKNWFLAIASGIVYLVNPSIYTVFAGSGLYARGFAMPFYFLTIAALVSLLQRSWKGKVRRVDYFWVIIFLSLTIIAHPVVGIVTIGTIILFWLLLSKNHFLMFKKLFKAGVLAALISLFFTLPFYVFPKFSDPPPDIYERMKANILSWDQIFYFWGQFDSTSMFWRNSTPFIFPLFFGLFILLVASIIIFKRRKVFQNFRFRLILTAVFTAILMILLTRMMIPIRVIPIFFGASVYTLIYAPFFVSSAVGISLYVLWKRKIFAIICAIILVASVLFWGYSNFPDPPLEKKMFCQRELEWGEIELTKKIVPEKQFNFRYGDHVSAGLGAWFNIGYPYTPQTRDYYVNGVINIDYYTYQQVATLNWTGNLPEAKFNLDWWGIKQFLLNYKDKPILEKYQNQPEFEYLIRWVTYYTAYEFKEAAPVLSATNVPSVLVIGKKDISFDVVFRSLAQGNLNSQHFIPVLGKENIDNYSLEELQKFDGVLLYGYDWKNQGRTEKVLLDYVERGGGLYIEANRDLNTEVLDIFPINDSAKSAFGKKFKIKESNQTIIKDIDYNKFSETIYDDKPWGMVQANEVKDTANTLINNYGKAVVVSQKVGNGRIVWSGINLPYHALMYKNEEEAKLLGQLLSWTVKSEDQKIESEEAILDKDLVYETESYKVEFINPEKRIVTIKKPASGILFKENYISNWRAKTAKEKLRVYPAGPKFMYVPLSKVVKEGDQIILEYKKTFWPEKFSFYVSLLTFLALIIYVFGGKIFEPLLNRIQDRINQPIKRTSEMSRNWWEEDENDY